MMGNFKLHLTDAAEIGWQPELARACRLGGCTIWKKLHFNNNEIYLLIPNYIKLHIRHRLLPYSNERAVLEQYPHVSVQN